MSFSSVPVGGMWPRNNIKTDNGAAKRKTCSSGGSPVDRTATLTGELRQPNWKTVDREVQDGESSSEEENSDLDESFFSQRYGMQNGSRNRGNDSGIESDEESINYSPIGSTPFSPRPSSSAREGNNISDQTAGEAYPTLFEPIPGKQPVRKTDLLGMETTVFTEPQTPMRLFLDKRDVLVRRLNDVKGAFEPSQSASIGNNDWKQSIDETNEKGVNDLQISGSINYLLGLMGNKRLNNADQMSTKEFDGTINNIGEACNTFVNEVNALLITKSSNTLKIALMGLLAMLLVMAIAAMVTFLYCYFNGDSLTSCFQLSILMAGYTLPASILTIGIGAGIWKNTGPHRSQIIDEHKELFDLMRDISSHKKDSFWHSHHHIENVANQSKKQR